MPAKKPEVIQYRPNDMDDMSMWESLTSITRSAAKVAVTVTGAVETTARSLDYYAQAAEVIGQSNLVTVKLNTAGSQAKKIERLKLKYPQMEWDKVLDEATT